MLNSDSYGNNSALVLTDIGEGGSALICLSDSTQCCRGADNPNEGTPLGNWSFPDDSSIRNSDVGGDIYITRGPSEVRLNRRNNAQSPTGVYRCEVVDARGNTQTILVDLQTCKFRLLTDIVEFGIYEFAVRYRRLYSTYTSSIAFPVPPVSPTNLAASPSQSPTSITLSWEQPAGDIVDRYDIVYTYQEGCSDYTQPENMTTVNDGTAREYTLQNLQEFSNYAISVAAVNFAGSSPAATAMVTTASSRK